MKFLKPHPQKCVGCRSCMKACSGAFFPDKKEEYSCIHISEQGKNIDINVCNQCGKCMAMCQPQAISQTSSGVIIINKKLCVGCLICVAECPTGAMRYHVAENSPFKCIACGVCVKKCTQSAIEIVKE